jgi:hypothetical protein
MTALKMFTSQTFQNRFLKNDFVIPDLIRDLTKFDQNQKKSNYVKKDNKIK